MLQLSSNLHLSKMSFVKSSRKVVCLASSDSSLSVASSFWENQ